MPHKREMKPWPPPTVNQGWEGRDLGCPSQGGCPLDSILQESQTKPLCPGLCQGPHAGLGHFKAVESPMGWALGAEDCGKLVSPSHHSHYHWKDLGTRPTER